MSETRPRLLVIGAGGFVGSWVARRAEATFDVTYGMRRATADAPSVAIDITQADSVRAAFDQARPEVVLLTAAMADIDRCEAEQPLAEAVNYLGPLHVAQECARRGTRLLFTSTDAVFDGTLRAYAEDAEPTPVNFYGRTKARAEAAIRNLLPTAAIVRCSLVLGRGPIPGTNSYIDKLTATFRAGKSVQVPTFEYRNPIDVATLTSALLALARSTAGGIFHIGSSDKMSRYQLARRVAEKLGVSLDIVQPLDAPPAGRAPRGLDDFLVCGRLPAAIAFVVPTCEQVIERALDGTP